MKLLILGDVMGESGRNALKHKLPEIIIENKSKSKEDFIKNLYLKYLNREVDDKGLKNYIRLYKLKGRK